MAVAVGVAQQERAALAVTEWLLFASISKDNL
jgi:hypothetical protein